MFLTEFAWCVFGFLFFGFGVIFPRCPPFSHVLSGMFVLFFLPLHGFQS